jgi:signal transduction histidine kinase
VSNISGNIVSYVPVPPRLITQWDVVQKTWNQDTLHSLIHSPPPEKIWVIPEWSFELLNLTDPKVFLLVPNIPQQINENQISYAAYKQGHRLILIPPHRKNEEHFWHEVWQKALNWLGHLENEKQKKEALADMMSASSQNSKALETNPVDTLRIQHERLLVELKTKIQLLQWSRELLSSTCLEDLERLKAQWYQDGDLPAKAWDLYHSVYKQLRTQLDTQREQRLIQQALSHLKQRWLILDTEYVLIADSFQHLANSLSTTCWQALGEKEICAGCKLGHQTEWSLPQGKVKSQPLRIDGQSYYLNIYEERNPWDEPERLWMHKQNINELSVIGASLAHEINNPLGIILSYTQLLLQSLDETAPPALKEDLLLIEERAKHLKQLVETWLGFARLKLGNLTEKPERVLLTSLRLAYLSHYVDEELWQEKHIKIELFPSAPPLAEEEVLLLSLVVQATAQWLESLGQVPNQPFAHWLIRVGAQNVELEVKYPSLLKDGHEESHLWQKRFPAWNHYVKEDRSKGVILLIPRWKN